MKFRISVIAAATALALGMSGSALAQFGGLSLPGLGKSSSAAVDVDGFLANVKVAEALMTKSKDQLFDSLASKEKKAEIEALKKQAAEATDPKEKEAKAQEIQKSEIAALNALDMDKVASEDIKKMDDKQKQRLAGAAFNFVLAVLKDKELIGQSQGIISGLSSNPANLMKLGSIKDAAGSLKNQIESASSLVGKIPKVFSAVGIKNPPTKASDAPMEVKGD